MLNIKTHTTMESLNNSVKFDTKVGIVEVVKHEDGGWVFEFISGFNDGLHCDVPFTTFDKCYCHIKKRMPDWVKEKNEYTRYHSSPTA